MHGGNISFSDRNIEKIMYILHLHTPLHRRNYLYAKVLSKSMIDHKKSWFKQTLRRRIDSIVRIIRRHSSKTALAVSVDRARLHFASLVPGPTVAMLSRERERRRRRRRRYALRRERREGGWWEEEGRRRLWRTYLRCWGCIIESEPDIPSERRRTH